MGGPIAGRLLSQGNQVYGTNRTKAKADPLIERGLRWRDTPRQVAEAADVIISMVTDSDALQAVTAGPDGILAGLRPGKVYLDMSTISPASSRELAGRVAARGATMLDRAGLRQRPGRRGRHPRDHGRRRPATPTAGSNRSCGSSAAPSPSSATTSTRLLLKLAINISLAVQMLAFSEGVLLAERGGIDRRLALDVLTGSAIGSPMLKARAPLLLEPPEKAWFDVAADAQGPPARPRRRPRPTCRFPRPPSPTRC